MVVAAVLSAALSVHGLPYEPLFVSVGASASTTVALWYDLWVRILVGLLALSIVNSLCARRRAADRLAERQERSRVLRQQLAYAQLRAIQARVDPQLLFDMLAAVKRYYEQDAARAEKLLDELTAFLRAALPRLRSVRSSLEVEFGLVGCYVRMLRAAGDTEIELQVSLPPALADAMFPAGVLLPLMTRPRPAAAGGARRISLDAQADDEGGPLRVRMTDAAAPDSAEFERLRASLADLYGDRARLRVLPLGAAGAEIEMEVPRERD
jgi:LytS/YehU family sensor histidine kinase